MPFTDTCRIMFVRLETLVKRGFIKLDATNSTAKMIKICPWLSTDFHLGTLRKLIPPRLFRELTYGAAQDLFGGNILISVVELAHQSTLVHNNDPIRYSLNFLQFGGNHNDSLARIR